MQDVKRNIPQSTQTHQLVQRRQSPLEAQQEFETQVVVGRHPTPLPLQLQAAGLLGSEQGSRSVGSSGQVQAPFQGSAEREQQGAAELLEG